MQGWKVGSLVAVTVGLFVGWYVASPWVTLYGIKSAVERRDVEAVIGYVDFDALRQNLKDQVHAAAATQRVPPTDASGWSIPDRASMELAALDRQIDAYVTPDAARALFAKQGAGRSGPINPVGDMVRDFAIDRETLGRFVVRGKTDRIGAGAIFTAHGLGWKLSGIRLPMGTARAGAINGPLGWQGL